MQGGGERVVDVWAEMYPEADIYALFVDEKQLSTPLRSRRVYGSLLNRFPFATKLHRHLLPLYPWAIESLDLRNYDLVISSCGPAVMGVSVLQDTLHICYCHTPQRSYWDLYLEHQEQLKGMKRQLFVLSASAVRTWEHCAMQRVDHVIANSNYIRSRIKKYLSRESTVIYPPVDTSTSLPSTRNEGYYLSVGRLEIQKRVDILIRACNQLGRKLLVSGTGKEEQNLKQLAGPTIEFLGRVPDEQLPILYSNARALLFAADEDFGIVPVEAQANGKPVIAYAHGGSLETIRHKDHLGRKDTGVLFDQQNAESLTKAIIEFEKREGEFDPEDIRAHAMQFDTVHFKASFSQFVNDAILQK